MKKYFQNFSYAGSIILYFFGTPAIIYITTLNCLRYSNKVTYCLSDVLCFNEHFTKFYLYPLILIIIINLIKEEFRAGVILRYQSSLRVMAKISEKLIVIASAAAVYQTVLTIIIGLIYTPFQCNWNSPTGYPFYLVKNIVFNMPSIIVIIILHFLSVFFTTLVIGLFVTVLWWLTSTPITGFIIVVALLSVESGIAIYVHVLFSIVSLRPDKIFLYGLDYWGIIGYPFIISFVLFAAGVVVIKKIDYLRLV